MAFVYAGQWGPEALLDLIGRLYISTAFTVVQAGTQTAATLYTDRTKATPQPNPGLVSSVTGNAKFFADPGVYDITVAGIPVLPGIIILPDRLEPVAAVAAGLIGDTQVAAISETKITNLSTDLATHTTNIATNATAIATETTRATAAEALKLTVAQTQGGSAGVPTTDTLHWSFQPSNQNFNPALAPFTLRFESAPFGGKYGPYMGLGYNVFQATAGEPAAYLTIFADAEDTPGGALQMQWNIAFPATSMIPLKVVANRDNTKTCSVTLTSGAGGGGILLCADGAGGANGPNYISCNGAGSGPGSIVLSQPVTFVKSAALAGALTLVGTAGDVASNTLNIGNHSIASVPCILQFDPATGANAQINFNYNGAAQWQIYQNGGGPLFFRNMVGAKMTMEFLHQAGSGNDIIVIDGKFQPVAANEATGSGSAALGANCPATTATAPYTWEKMRSSDGSTVYFPVWK